MKVKAISILLLAAMLTSLSACGQENPPAADDTADTTVDTADLYPDDLPDGMNLGGKTVTFLYRNEIADEFYVAESTGDIVDDAIYESFLTVEERLNVDIEVVTKPGHITSVRQEYLNHITSTVLAGDDTYDWIDLMVTFSSTMVREGLFKNLTSNQYIDFSKPWYVSDLEENIALDGKLYFLTGDISLGYLKSIFCTYFNTGLAADYGIENLYNVVDEGRWTLDKLMEISAAASKDVNNDGSYNMDDELGFVIHDQNHIWGFMMGTDIRVLTEDDSGNMVINFGTDRDASICEKVYRLINNTAGSYHPKVTNANASQLEAYNNVTTKFISDKLLIMTAEMDDAVAQFRDMKSGYGILPFPKYDEAQKNYYSVSRATHNVFTMPITCSDPDSAGAVMEALSSSNHETVLPAYYETALKTKYIRDDDSARMYDLIRAGTILDYTFIYNTGIGEPIQLFNSSILKENSMASNIASMRSGIESKLAAFLTDVRENCTD